MKKLLFLLLFLCLSVVSVSAQETPVWNERPPDLIIFSKIEAEDFLDLFAGDPVGPDFNPADSYNNFGYDAYTRGDLMQAALLWSAAVDADETHALAHYNLACALALFMRAFTEEEKMAYLNGRMWGESLNGYGEYLYNILELLEISIVNDPGRLERMKTDPDLSQLPDTEDVRSVFLGPDPGIEDVLCGFDVWYSVMGAAYTPDDRIMFYPDHTVEFRNDFEGLHRVYGDDYTEDLSFSGTWRVDGETVIIETDDGRTYSGVLRLSYNARGFIIHRQLEIGGLGPFSDEISHFWACQDA